MFYREFTRYSLDKIDVVTMKAADPVKYGWGTYQVWVLKGEKDPVVLDERAKKAKDGLVAKLAKQHQKNLRQYDRR